MYASQWVQLTVQCSRTVAKGILQNDISWSVVKEGLVKSYGIESKCGTAWWCGKILRLRSKLFTHLIGPGGTLGRVGRWDVLADQNTSCANWSHVIKFHTRY